MPLLTDSKRPVPELVPPREARDWWNSWLVMPRSGKCNCSYLSVKHAFSSHCAPWVRGIAQNSGTSHMRACWQHSARQSLQQQSSHCRTGRGWSASITTLLFPIKYLPSPLRNGRWKFEPAEQCKQRGPQRVDPSCPCPWIPARPVSNDRSPERP